MNFIKKSLIIGLITTALLGIVVFITKLLWGFLAPFKYLSLIIFGRYIFGFELIGLLIFMFIIGFLINIWEKRKGPIEKRIRRIPLVEKFLNLIQAIKDTVSYWFGRSEKKHPYVAVKLSSNSYRLGITAYNRIKINGKDMIAVAIVSWPFPNTGPFIDFYQENQIIPLDNIPVNIIIQLQTTGTLLKVIQDLEQKQSPTL